MKKVLCAVLLTLVLCAAMPMFGLAEETKCEEHFYVITDVGREVKYHTSRSSNKAEPYVQTRLECIYCKDVIIAYSRVFTPDQLLESGYIIKLPAEPENLTATQKNCEQHLYYISKNLREPVSINGTEYNQRECYCIHCDRIIRILYQATRGE